MSYEDMVEVVGPDGARSLESRWHQLIRLGSSVDGAVVDTDEVSTQEQLAPDAGTLAIGGREGVTG